MPNPGWREIDPEVWWEATIDGLKQLLCDVDKAAIRGIGITGQMHTLILLDKDGKPLRPAMLWNDMRTEELIPEVAEKIKGTEADHIRQFISTGSPAANLLWVKRNEPEVFQNIRRFLVGPDYLVYRFTGITGIDFCEASTSSLYDVIKRRWSPVMLELIGIDESICPRVRGSAEIAGTIRPEVAEMVGLEPTVVVIVGTGDNPAAAIPTGCLGKNYPVMSLGTSAAILSAYKRR